MLWFLFSCAAAVPFVYSMCPETDGKSLEDIDLIFAKPSMRECAGANERPAHVRYADIPAKDQSQAGTEECIEQVRER